MSIFVSIPEPTEVEAFYESGVEDEGPYIVSSARQTQGSRQTQEQSAASTQGRSAHAHVPPPPDHYWENVVFQVENAFFKVPTHHFVTQSEVFADMLSLPQGPAAATAEGQSKENPIVLPVTELDFRRLLRALYPLYIAQFDILISMLTPASLLYREAPKSPSFNKEELVSLLKLSKLWAMKRVREYAVEKITDILNSIDAIERVILAREYSVEKWLRSGYMALAMRYPVVSTGDARQIGWESALLLEHVREEAHAAHRVGRGSLSEYHVQSGVESKFSVEFQGIRMAEAAYRV